jgi:hypothetical protein
MLSDDRLIAILKHEASSCGQTDYKHQIADLIESLRAENEELRRVNIRAGAALSAAISLLERGGREAAPSDKMFEQMLVDYKNSLDSLMVALRGEGEK